MRQIKRKVVNNMFIVDYFSEHECRDEQMEYVFKYETISNDIPYAYFNSMYFIVTFYQLIKLESFFDVEVKAVIFYFLRCG